MGRVPKKSLILFKVFVRKHIWQECILVLSTFHKQILHCQNARLQTWRSPWTRFAANPSKINTYIRTYNHVRMTYTVKISSKEKWKFNWKLSYRSPFDVILLRPLCSRYHKLNQALTVGKFFDKVTLWGKHLFKSFIKATGS